MKQFLFILLAFFSVTQLQAQLRDTFPEEHPEMFERKFRFGATFQLTWTNVLGSQQPFDYFAKPSQGGGIEFNYFFSKNWGIGAGLSYQQRGAGIYTPDLVKEIGDPDSTHRHRLRMNCIDLPVWLLVRLNKGVSKGTRWSGSIGGVLSYIPRTGSIFHSIEDGFHKMENWSKDFSKWDVGVTLSWGLDFNAAEAALFRFHVYSSFGFVNPYRNTTLFGNARGFNLMAGIKLSAMFSTKDPAFRLKD